MLKIDTRGMSCPQPVLMTKKALENSDSIEVLVDSPVAKGNILRYAKSNAYNVQEKTEGEDILLSIKK